jgi:hypothetical protein
MSIASALADIWRQFGLAGSVKQLRLMFASFLGCLSTECSASLFRQVLMNERSTFEG